MPNMTLSLEPVGGGVGGNHLGGVAYLRIVDVHGGTDPLGQIQLRCLLGLPRRQGFPAGKQLPLQHYRLVIHHLKFNSG